MDIRTMKMKGKRLVTLRNMRVDDFQVESLLLVTWSFENKLIRFLQLACVCSFVPTVLPSFQKQIKLFTSC